MSTAGEILPELGIGRCFIPADAAHGICGFRCGRTEARASLMCGQHSRMRLSRRSRNMASPLLGTASRSMSTAMYTWHWPPNARSCGSMRMTGRRRPSLRFSSTRKIPCLPLSTFQRVWPSARAWAGARVFLSPALAGLVLLDFPARAPAWSRSKLECQGCRKTD